MKTLTLMTFLLFLVSETFSFENPEDYIKINYDSELILKIFQGKATAKFPLPQNPQKNFYQIGASYYKNMKTMESDLGDSAELFDFIKPLATRDSFIVTKTAFVIPRIDLKKFFTDDLGVKTILSTLSLNVEVMNVTPTTFKIHKEVLVKDISQSSYPLSLEGKYTYAYRGQDSTFNWEGLWANSQYENSRAQAIRMADTLDGDKIATDPDGYFFLYGTTNNHPFLKSINALIKFYPLAENSDSFLVVAYNKINIATHSKARKIKKILLHKKKQSIEDSLLSWIRSENGVLLGEMKNLTKDFPLGPKYQITTIEETDDVVIPEPVEPYDNTPITPFAGETFED